MHPMTQLSSPILSLQAKGLKAGAREAGLVVGGVWTGAGQAACACGVDHPLLPDGDAPDDPALIGHALPLVLFRHPPYSQTDSVFAPEYAKGTTNAPFHFFSFRYLSLTYLSL
jgi:hypothetical protein